MEAVSGIMRRRILSVLLLAAAAVSALAAGTIKLYLTDGSYHLVREYKVESDRVRFYSAERGDWEEVPAALVDLKKTEGEIKQREESQREEAATLDAEEKAEREARREVRRVPVEAGVYLVEGDAVKAVKAGESKVVNNRRRSILKAMSPIPLITGKATVELDGPHSPTTVSGARPEFYIRLSNEERFGIVRMGARKENRVVENLTIVPVTKEVIEEPALVDTFRKQVAEGLYKIWPEKDLAPGEYAVVEYTEGKVNIQVWDFRYQPK